MLVLLLVLLLLVLLLLLLLLVLLLLLRRWVRAVELARVGAGPWGVGLDVVDHVVRSIVLLLCIRR